MYQSKSELVATVAIVVATGLLMVSILFVLASISTLVIDFMVELAKLGFGKEGFDVLG